MRPRFAPRPRSARIRSGLPRHRRFVGEVVPLEAREFLSAAAGPTDPAPGDAAPPPAERAPEFVGVAALTRARRAETIARVLRLGRSPGAGAAAPGATSMMPAPPRPSPALAAELRPLTDLVGSYCGFEGGLYGGGSNEPPPGHAAIAAGAAASIRPLDRSGRPAPDGRIGVVLIGPSTTMLQGQVFARVASRDPRVAPGVRVVNGAQNEMVAQSWAGSAAPWSVLSRQLAASGVSKEQVQVAWIKAGHLSPFQDGAFPAHAERYAELLAAIARRAREAFPNLRIAYLSSEVTFAFAARPVLPEPFAFEGAFGVRSVIDRQIAGDPGLNADPSRGPVVAPVLLWGPYPWARTDRPRADGLVWTQRDFQPDGVHPSAQGSPKVAGLLLQFLLGDPTSHPWFRS